MAVLVTGGAGFIGSHTALYLTQQGEDVIVLDNLITGNREACLYGTFYEGDIKDEGLLVGILKKHKIHAVIHFAASALVGESIEDPLSYYENNVLGTYTLLKQMINNKVNYLVFSSTSTVYGDKNNQPLKETDLELPINPYGETKLAIEKMLHWFDNAYGLKSVSFRYFNAAGADPKGRIGEARKIETHLIPITLQVALGQREKLFIYGEDYGTKDGTCIRDYVHVMDLAEAHYLALENVRKTNKSEIYNLGNEKGYSVREVIDMCRKVTGKTIVTETQAKRPGDPAVLVASSKKAITDLSWKPKYSSLRTIVEHAWNWHKNNPHGFNSQIKKLDSNSGV